MPDLTIRESMRHGLQSALDRIKTQTERNKLGQFPTPDALAREILECALPFLSVDQRVRFFDPAFGLGSFYSALLQVFQPERIASVAGYEVDQMYGHAAAQLWKGTQLQLHIADFTSAQPPTTEADKPNLLVCNPPYVRHHHLLSQDKKRLNQAVQTSTRVTLSQLAGLYPYFLLLAHAWLAEGGLGCWLIPSEFMDVNYGEPVKQYLLSQVTLLRVHRFDPLGVQFEDALVSSSVLFFRKAKPPASHLVEFTYGHSLAQPSLRTEVPITSLAHKKKWMRVPGEVIATSVQPNRPTLADLFTIRRGLATGDNGFFILTSERVAEYQISSTFLHPILPSPRNLPTRVVEADAQGNPIGTERLYLLSCDLPESVIEKQFPRLWQYLQLGIELGVNKRFLCKSRNPWYRQEKRSPAPLLCTYMGRQAGEGQRSFRFIRNDSIAKASNAYLLLYPKPELAAFLGGHPERIQSLHLALNQIDPKVMLQEGRVYGGGLNKLEPKELGNVPIESVLDVMPDLKGIIHSFNLVIDALLDGIPTAMLD